jgi:peroxiredoxin
MRPCSFIETQSESLMRCVILTVLGCSLSTMVACRQPPSTPPAVEADDVYGVLRRVTDFYQKIKTFQVDYSQENTLEGDGISESTASKAEIIVERPNRFAMRNSDAPDLTDVVCNGAQVWMSVPELKKYTQSEAPGSLDQLLGNAAAKGRRPVLELFSHQAYERLMENMRRGDYVGREEIDGIGVEHLRFEYDQFTWDAWVEAGERPALRQVRFELETAPSSRRKVAPQLASAKMVCTQRYDNWRFDVPVPEGAFWFDPPAGFKKVDSLLADRNRPSERSRFVGHPAPDVEFSLLNGVRLRLKDLRSEKLVILDFWATWCSPCLQELPLVTKVAGEYRDKDVSLYCVNQNEDAETIFKFISQHKVDGTIGLDPSGEVGGAFGAQALPTLVLIDKAGVVQAVHVGFSPDIGQTLKDEIEALLAGKNLASQAGDEANDGDVSSDR